MVTVYYILFISNFICTLTNIKNKFLVNVTTISLALLFIASNGEIGDSILYKEAFEYREDSNAYGFEMMVAPKVWNIWFMHPVPVSMVPIKKCPIALRTK